MPVSYGCMCAKVMHGYTGRDGQRQAAQQACHVLLLPGKTCLKQHSLLGPRDVPGGKLEPRRGHFISWSLSSSHSPCDCPPRRGGPTGDRVEDPWAPEISSSVLDATISGPPFTLCSPYCFGVILPAMRPLARSSIQKPSIQKPVLPIDWYFLCRPATDTTNPATTLGGQLLTSWDLVCPVLASVLCRAPFHRHPLVPRVTLGTQTSCHADGRACYSCLPHPHPPDLDWSRRTIPGPRTTEHSDTGPDGRVSGCVAINRCN